MEELHNYYLLICTPCFANLMSAGYFHSVLQLKEKLIIHRVKHEIATTGNESLITRARNYFVSIFLSKPEYTHLLFIDSDITFNPDSVIRMLISKKEVVGGAYPKKSILWETIPSLVLENPNITPEQLEKKSHDYALNVISHYDPNQYDSTITLQITNGYMKVAYIATGFMLLTRNVLESMMVFFPELKYENDVPGYNLEKNQNYFYSLFDCIIDPHSRRYLSEDYAFCNRWIKMGGDIWLDVTCNLNHSGSYDFKGGIMEKFRSHVQPIN